MFLLCFIFCQVTAMVINKKESKIYKFFASSSYGLASTFASIIYTNIHLKKPVDNIC